MIPRKTTVEIAYMREVNRILAELFVHIEPMIQPGITTAELDQEAELFIRSRGAKPAFKGYRGYPATLCTSINEVIIHGIPGERRLAEGDIIGIDVGAVKNDFYGDTAVTYAVGAVTPEAESLMETAQKALYNAIEQAKMGGRLYDISAAIQTTAESAGFSCVREFVGHGIGRALHEDPQIPNVGKKGTGPVLEEGMTLAIETMINQGVWRVKILPDGWTAVTADGKLSAHYEHTIAVTKDGPQILSTL